MSDSVTRRLSFPDRCLATGSEDALWDAVGGRRLVMLETLGDDGSSAGGWLAWTLEGWYTGSDGACARIRWRVGGRTRPASAFAPVYRRPDRVAQVLGGR